MTKRSQFYIDDKLIGGGRCFIIAEIAQAHDGSLGTAHAYIDAVAKTGSGGGGGNGGTTGGGDGAVGIVLIRYSA